MKQLIVVLLLLGGGYYLYTNGFLNVIKSQVGVNSEAFMGDKQKAVAPKTSGLPDIDPLRTDALKGKTEDMGRIEKVVFDAYDPDTCFSFVELAYENGADNVEILINKYINAFQTPEARGKILALLSKYKDRQTLEILKNFLLRGTFPKKVLLNKIAAFKCAEIVPVINDAMKSSDASLAAEAKKVNDEISKQPWYGGNRAPSAAAGNQVLPNKQITQAMNSDEPK